MLVLIRGAGDLASGIALRLHHAHLSVVMTDLPQPTAIRRTVCFSQAIVYGSMTVEDVTARVCAAPEDAAAILAAGEIPVLADPEARSPAPRIRTSMIRSLLFVGWQGRPGSADGPAGPCRRRHRPD